MNIPAKFRIIAFITAIILIFTLYSYTSDEEIHIINEETSNYSLSTCSNGSNEKGQKVICFTYYEGSTFDTFNRNYFSGVQLNLDALNSVYGSSYKMRL